MVASALTTVLVLVLFFALGVSAWSSIKALRIGVFTNRDGLQISRVENPIVFWISISLGLGIPAVVLCLGSLIAARLLIANPG
jgi:hypothetical protein